MDASVASSAHGNIDEQISQLMECKPLSEQDVIIFLILILFGDSLFFINSRFLWSDMWDFKLQV